MSLIKSISGIRGTIGGRNEENLTPIDIVKFTYAYASELRKNCEQPKNQKLRVVVGKDGRISGEMVENLVVGTLVGCGIDVVKCGYASTPTTEMAVKFANADGGIIITASHNPKQWNALKLLNSEGEFLDAVQAQAVIDCAEKGEFDFASVEDLGTITEKDFTDDHIKAVIDLKAVDEVRVRDQHFKVVLDAINSVGSIIMPKLLEQLGVECVTINSEITGDFAHNPEPLPQNLKVLSEMVVKEHADLGISVDPDVDRLAFICENGEPFVEENTLIAVTDYLFSRYAAVAKANNQTLDEVMAPYSPVSVSNLSSSRGLKDVTEKWGGKYLSSKVGEVNVTTLIHESNALIGGEGNGGVIFPMCHCGRDAMVGVGIFLTMMAARGQKVSEIKASLPQYFIAKNRIELSDKSLIDKILSEMKRCYSNEDIDIRDGVKISFENKKEWVLLRKSNTEPIIRVYSEAPSEEEANKLASEIIDIANRIIKENS